jgi:bis(5'-nucleosyl)-tetraphosphatase (symmetrical)
MAIYAVGDVQGCYEELARLLETLRLDGSRDEIWFVGDLVNRGPDSLRVLRLVRSLGTCATTVLGNHDLHLLALSHGNRARAGDRELAAVLAASDAPELLAWLRQQPLAHYRPELNTLVVHAGVPPQWDPLLTVKLAREVEQTLRGPGCQALMSVIYGDEPDCWNPALAGFDRQRFIVNALTRIRYCTADGRLDFRQKGAPEDAPAGLVPWFSVARRASAAVRIVFGHWSTLGLVQRPNLLGLDTGCVWGGSLTAVRLDGPARTWSVKARRR